MKTTFISILCVFFNAFVNPIQANDYYITDYGAKPTAIINTSSINATIMACHENGGGRVIVPAGKFRTGTLLMKDNVELHLMAGAILWASTDSEDIPLQPAPAYKSQKDPGGWRALIYAENVSNIAITGVGIIDGNGFKQTSYPGNSNSPDLDGRPRNIVFISCSNIRVEGITLLNSGMWNQHYLNCEYVFIDRINVYNHSNKNNDGIDIDGCRDFILSNSIFDSDDDGIVLKSTGEKGCEDIVITNCIVSSFCNAIKAGTESTGGFRNITISNCIVRPSRANHLITGTKKGITGISLEIVDGGIMEGITISNVTIHGTDCPLYIRLGNRGRKHTHSAPLPDVGVLKNISINNLIAYDTGNYSSSITGIPEHYIENVSLSNITLINQGNVLDNEFTNNISNVPEDEKGYPQPTVWGELPSSGFFIRHVKNISIQGLTLASAAKDIRTPIIAIDVIGLHINVVSKMNNPTALFFFEGWNSHLINIERPLGWKGKYMQIHK